MEMLCYMFVYGVSEELIYIITAYYPDDVEWEENRERRRKQ